MTDEQTPEMVNIMLDDTGVMGDVPLLDPSKINDPNLRHDVWLQSPDGQAHIHAMHDAAGKDLTLDAIQAEADAQNALHGTTVDGIITRPVVDIPDPGTAPGDQLLPPAEEDPGASVMPPPEAASETPEAPSGLPAGFAVPTA